MFSELTIELFCRCLAESYQFKNINEMFVSHQLVSPQSKIKHSRKLKFARSVLFESEPYCGKVQREKSTQNLFSAVMNERLNQYKIDKFSTKGKEIAQQISRLKRSVGRDGYSFSDNKLSLSKITEVDRAPQPKVLVTNQHVLIMTFLNVEYVAVKALLFSYQDEVKAMRLGGAATRYLTTELTNRLGENLLVTLVLADMGNTSSSAWTIRFLDYFKDIKYVLVVGIGGGVPDPSDASNHVRLGDVVVSNYEGVIQYDMVNLGQICNSPRPPCSTIQEFSNLVSTQILEGADNFHRYIKLGCERLGWYRPDASTDRIYSSKSPKLEIMHPHDELRKRGESRVFDGAIASSNQLLRDPGIRDSLKDSFSVKVVEMEGAGVAEAAYLTDVGFFIVRGVVDYCDSHKDKRWQQYASIVAASYAKCLVDQF